MSGSAGRRKQLGKIMLRQKLVSPAELEELLGLQESDPGQRLASTAVQSGKVQEVDLLKALSEQHGLPGIDLGQVVVPLANLKLIPAEIAKQHLILPLLVKDDRIFLAMADPGDRRVIDEIEFVTGRRVFPYVALHDALSAVIEAAYQLEEQGQHYYVGPRVPPEYLESLGLEEGGTALDSEPAPGAGGGVVLDRELAGGHLDDGLASGQAAARPDLDSVFPSDGAGSGLEDVPAPPRSADRRSPKVLVVDDEEDIRRLLRRVLAERGYEVVEAADGLAALQSVRDESPDVILLDAMLPEVHGFDICRRLKGSKRYGQIPIVMVSAVYRGWRFAEDLKTSYGVDVFLEKPFKITTVLTHVERAIEGRLVEPSEEDGELSREAGDALQRGIQAYQDGDLDAAITHLRSGIAIDPLSYKLHYHLGLLFGRRDNLFEAIHELETAVDLLPRSFPALKNLAVLYQRVGFRNKAMEMWERALSSAPNEETRQGIKDHLISLL